MLADDKGKFKMEKVMWFPLLWSQVTQPLVTGGGNASTPVCSVTEQGQSFVLNHNESGKVQINSSHSIEMSAGIAHGHEGVDIKIESQKGDLQLFAANGKVWIKGDDINITSGGDLTMHAANDMKITADNRMEIYAPILILMVIMELVFHLK